MRPALANLARRTLTGICDGPNSAGLRHPGSNFLRAQMRLRYTGDACPGAGAPSGTMRTYRPAAVDRSAHGRGLGRMLLAYAVNRTVAAREFKAMRPLIADAASDDAKRFYERFGFVPLTDDAMRLFLPLGPDALQGPKR